jgi:rsbT antagonist protein RsbS
MRVPILKQGDCLIASVQAAPTDTALVQLQQDLVEQAGRFHSRGAIIDVTALDVMDSFACRALRAVTQVLRLRGTETAVVGIQPEVAFSMAQLGLTLEGAATALDLGEGLAHFQKSKGGANRGG